MAERTANWEGESGKEYKYWIYPLGTTFKQVPGNYVFARETEPDIFTEIYIGQTKDLSERFDNHHKMPCILKNKATHICAHTSSDDEEERRAEEDDLVERWNPVCNDND